MDKRSPIFKRGFSIRQAFTVTNLVILTVGTTFSVVILGSVIQSNRIALNFRLAKELAVSGSRVDAAFSDARSTVQALALGIPFVLNRSPVEFADWMKAQAAIHLPSSPTLFDLYFAFAEKSARRMFDSPGMAFAVTRNLAYSSTPDFDSPSTFRVSTYRDPGYQTSAAEIWYQGALRSPEIFRTPFYYDATYFKQVMISITQAVREPKAGAVLGVAGVDLTAGQFARMLASNPIGKTGGVLLTDASGVPLAPFMGRDIPMAGYRHSPENATRAAFDVALPESPRLDCRAGTHQVLSPDGQPYIYQSLPLREPGFCVVAYQKKSEAYAALYWAVGLMALLSAVVLFTSLYFRQLLARFVIQNIEKILENINANREHFTEPGESGYRRLEPEGPREIARIAHQLNLLYQRLQLAFTEIRSEKDRAELATKAKSRFLSVMSHEIRTPLNAMLGLTDVLLLSPLNSEQVRHLRVLQRSGQSLLRILNDILDFSRLEAGKLFIEPHEFDLTELLDDIESLMRFDAEAKGLRFQISLPESDYRLSGDSIRVRQTLLNLVGNAIKFTDAGWIEVRVEALPSGNSDLRDFRFAVTDSGIGMSRDQLAKVFSEFAQADASITRRYGGTGLGLSISRHIVELLGGKISVRSEPGNGSTFQFTIPLRVLSERARQERAKPAPLDAASIALGPPSERALPILVVDDDEDNHRLITAYAKFLPDIRLVHAFSAKEALAKIGAEDYALVLMDMQMPEMDGLDATQEIRRLEAAGKIPRRPVLILSANTFAEDREKSVRAGADEHLSKPITLDRFKAMLKRWLPAA